MDTAVGPAWTLIGPRPTRTTDDAGAGRPIASGRVTALAVDPRRASTVYLGAAQGGVWKSTDGGQTWGPLTDNQVSLAIGSLAIDPQKPDTIYAGTGEENFSNDSYYGAGVLKSTDGGTTWQSFQSIFGGPDGADSGGAFIGSIAVHPANSQILLAGVNGHSGQASGIYRSSDAGVTWQSVLAGAPGTGVVFDPEHPDTVFAALGDVAKSVVNGIYVSSDAGLHWAPSNGTAPRNIPVAQAGRISLTISAAQPQILYAAIQDLKNPAALGIFKTTDSGKTWQQFAAPSYCYNDCWYANVIQVHPTDSDLVLVGGQTFYLSKTGGTVWQPIVSGANAQAIHYDVHALSFSADGTRLYVGSDGGAYRADNLVETYPEDIEWANLNATLAITQFYQGCSIHPTDPNFMLCGAQDNGVQAYTGTATWDVLDFGDGGWTAIDSARPSVFYLSLAGDIDLEKSTPFGQFSGIIPATGGIDRNDLKRCSFTPPYVLDPANPLRLYFGCWRIYESDDGGGSWSVISEDLAGRDGYISAIAVSPVDSRRVYAGSSHGEIHASSNAGSLQAAIWSSSGAGLPGRSVTSLIADSHLADTAYAGFSGFSGFDDRLGHVFKTTDGGDTWTDISSNLPNIPVNTLVQDPDSAGTLFAGTDIGVFVTSNGGASWSPFGQGLPRVAVMDLHIVPSSRVLRAATHGRSMWEISLGRAATLAPVIESAAPALAAAPGSGSTLFSIGGIGFDPSSVIRWNGFPLLTTVVSGTQLTVSASVPSGAGGRASLQLVNPSGVRSNVFNIDLGPTPVITQVDNAASLNATMQLAPGAIATVFGTGFAPLTASAPGSDWPYSLAGAMVEIRNLSAHSSLIAPLLYVSPQQINFQVPWGAPISAPGANGTFTAEITVVQGTRVSAPVGENFDTFSPAIYTLPNSVQGWIVNADGTIAGPAGANSHPASAGQTLTLFADGLGPPWSSQNLMTLGTPQVTVAGAVATVVSSTETSGTSGLYLVSFVAPVGIQPTAAAPVVLTFAGLSSNTATIAVQ